MKSPPAWPLGALTLALLSGLLVGLPRCTDTATFPRDAAPSERGPAELDRGPSPDLYQNPCAPSPPPSVSGRVYAPNGIDPVAGASVGVPLTLTALPRTVACETCSVGGRFSAHTFSGEDGSFELVGVPNTESFSLSIQKGHFRRVVKVTGLPACGHLDLGKETTTLPGKNGAWDPLDEIPSIGVISGRWDHLEKVLDKLGVQEKTVYDGTIATSTAVPNLLQDNIKLRSHHLLLVDCGTWFDALAAEPGPRANLREYLRLGGRLFVTDRSYDFVEQTFPELIDFERSDATPQGQPEELDAAEVGSTMTAEVPAAILDPSLKAWLQLPEIKALLPGDIIPVSGLESPWAVMASVNSAVGGKTWVSGPVVWAGGKGVRPLTASGDYRGQDGSGCGRVIFSSYHTWGEAPELLPQERILEYLILEIGSCMDIK
jgi:hypothetical protein